MHTVAAAAQQGGNDTQFLFLRGNYEYTLSERILCAQNEHKEHEGVGYRG